MSRSIVRSVEHLFPTIPTFQMLIKFKQFIPDLDFSFRSELLILWFLTVYSVGFDTVFDYFHYLRSGGCTKNCGQRHFSINLRGKRLTIPSRPINDICNPILQITFRLLELGSILWFPCILWNSTSPEKLWALNPKKLLLPDPCQAGIR